MKTFRNTLFTLSFLIIANSIFAQKAKKGWYKLFDGKTFAGWQVNEENPSTFSIEDGLIKVAGPRTHLFYNGPVGNHNFKNFELKATVKTMPGSNSGIFFHTAYQAKGWPNKGYEVQVNQTHEDWRKTGSLYSFDDVKEVSVKDNEWYNYHIVVIGKKVTIKINNKTVVDYTEPDPITDNRAERRLGSGTIALQGHDPKSIVYYKDVRIKLLPE